jgi:Flp pilus assembly secretin CpaC
LEFFLCSYGIDEDVVRQRESPTEITGKRMQMRGAVLTLALFFLTTGVVFAQEYPASENSEVAAISLPISVPVNKSVVIRLRQKARKILVVQPKIVEVVLLAPDLVLVNGKAVGATSVVILTERAAAR